MAIGISSSYKELPHETMTEFTFEVTLVSGRVKNVIILSTYRTRAEMFLQDYLKNKGCKNYSVKFLSSSPLREGVVKEVKVKV